MLNCVIENRRAQESGTTRVLPLAKLFGPSQWQIRRQKSRDRPNIQSGCAIILLSPLTDP